MLNDSRCVDWETCTKSCGGGIQKRRRTCLVNGDKCAECLEETRLCNDSPCPGKFRRVTVRVEDMASIVAVQQVAVWTDWTPMRNSANEDLVVEKRTRFVCTMASSVDRHVPEIKSDTVRYRLCSKPDASDCQETGTMSSSFAIRSLHSKSLSDSFDNLPGSDWSSWSAWSGTS